MLQKIQEDEDIVILASNLVKNIDDAFMRRMHFWIEITFPDEGSRIKIWENIIPRSVPIRTM